MKQEMKRIEKENDGRESYGEDERWVYDDSVDYKGKIPLRSSTGVWKASLFIIAIEFSERLCYFGIVTNLITYLNQIIHQDLSTAAKNVNYWAGVAKIMPFIGGFLADSYTGRFAMVLFSSLIYLMGLILLTLSQYIPILRPCSGHTAKCSHPRMVHEAVFFLGLYMISVGTGGHKPSLESFGADQFDDNQARERKQKMSFFNLWSFTVCSGLLMSVTLIVYVQDNVSWGVAFLIFTISMAIATVIFCCGRASYRYRVPQGTAFTPTFQVLVAAFRKRKLDYPSDPARFYQPPKSNNAQPRLLCHTNRLRFLDKGAIIEENKDNSKNPWRLTTLTRVEEVKLILNTIPIWLTSLTFGVGISITHTFFVKQAASTNRHIGSFEIPPASIGAVTALSTISFLVVYDRLLVPALRRATGNERGIDILHRIGLGMVLSMAGMVVAALVETKRRRWQHHHARMSVWWLVPQHAMLGFADGLTLVGLQEYFYEQVPDSMRSLGMALFLSITGVGSFFLSFLISAVDRVTSNDHYHGWIGKDLKSSRLDKFYWLLAVLSALNLCVYVCVAKGYTYKTINNNKVNSDASNGVEV